MPRPPPAFGAPANGVRMLWVLLLVLLASAALLGLATGPASIGLGQIIQAMTPGGSADSAVTQTILQLRLPRVVLGMLVGAALASAGAAMQGVFRNPLAEPGLAGVSSGAALAAVALIVLGHGGIGGLPEAFALPAATFLGAGAACAVVVRLAQVDGVTHAATLLLAGVAINAVAGGAIGLLSYIAADDALRTATYWMFGSLARAGWTEIVVAGPVLLLAILWLPRYAGALNVLQLGESEASYLGIDVERLKRGLLLWVLLAVGASVALAGAIGFIGLIAPQLVRLAVGPDQRRVMPLSALLGAALLSLADWVARTVAAPADLPIGILTALIGGPFFIALLLRLRRHPLLSGAIG